MAIKTIFRRAAVGLAVLAAVGLLAGGLPARADWADIRGPIRAIANADVWSTFPWRAGSLAVADFNADGKIDAAAAGTYVAGVAVLLSGRELTQTWISTDAWPIALAAADFTGDGAIDLAVAEQDAGGICLLTNNGSGTFSRGPLLPSSGGPDAPAPSAVAAIDYNKDGRMDLVVANRAADSLAVLRNTGSGFVLQQTLPVAGGPSALVVADLDGDTWDDLAVACPTEDAVRIVQNNHGLLGPGSLFEAGPYPEAVAAADLDGDGDLDLAAADREAPQVTLLLNGGGFQFTSQAVQLSDPAKAFDPPVDVQLVDMNLDGKVDIRCSGMVLLNKGPASFVICNTNPLYGMVYSQGYAQLDPVVFLGEAFSGDGLGISHGVIVSHPRMPPIVGDVNGDLHVDVLDLLQVIAAFGACQADATFNAACDFNADTCVDVLDLLFLIEKFGV